MSLLFALQFGSWPQPSSPTTPADPGGNGRGMQRLSGVDGEGKERGKERAGGQELPGKENFNAGFSGSGGGSGGGGGGERGVGFGRAVWALDGILEPVAVRFRFHFEEERATNRVDREYVQPFYLKKTVPRRLPAHLPSHARPREFVFMTQLMGRIVGFHLGFEAAAAAWPNDCTEKV